MIQRAIRILRDASERENLVWHLKQAVMKQLYHPELESLVDIADRGDVKVFQSAERYIMLLTGTANKFHYLYPEIIRSRGWCRGTK